MEYALLGQSDLKVSRLGFGCEPLGGMDWGEVDEDAALAAVSRALDLGVNLFDTANVYGLGRSEELLAKGLGAHRHEAVIVTKFGINWTLGLNGERAQTFRDASAKHVREALEASLRRLQLDCIPLYLIHWPDPNTPVEETLDALVQCQEAGKVRHIGVSNFPLSLMQQAHQVQPLTAIEMQYNLLDRKIEDEVLPFCQKAQVGVLAYGPLAQGLLSGKFGAEARFDASDRRSRLPHFQGEAFRENLELVQRLREVGQSYGKTPAQVAIRWVLDHPAITCAIAGAKSTAQLESNAQALNWQLSSQERQYIEGGAPSPEAASH